jgi:hypothetical protein
MTGGPVTERIISADSHLELKPEKILGHLRIYRL